MFEAAALADDRVLLAVIDDVQRQSALLRQEGQVPLRIRMSGGTWRSCIRGAARLTKKFDTDRPEPPTLCGLPVRVDEAWDGPPAVETVTEQKPTG